MSYSLGTRAQCDTVKDARDKLLGAPVRGVQCGGGKHEPMPQTWDGVGPVPPGWTGLDGPVETATAGTWAVDVGNGEITQALADARASKVSAQEKTTLQTAVATAVATFQSKTAPPSDETATKG